MALKIFASPLNKALIGANLLLLICFWWCFFAQAAPYQPGSPAWEEPMPLMVVFNRGLGSSLSMIELQSIPIFRVAFFIYMPCLLATWPIGRFLSPEFYVLGTNAQGLRLILITVLSFGQWALVVRIGTFLLHTRKHQNQ